MAEFEHPLFSKRGPATLSKDVYSDVSNVPPKSFAARIEVYADIFSDFYARKPLSSMPFLDFPDSDFADNLPFDYSDVFGGSNGVDFGISCDEVLAAESKWAEHPSAESWTPTEKYSHWQKPAVSKECNRDILAHSEKNGFLSNGASHCYDGGQQFNVSCNKTKQGAKDYSMTAIKHIDKLHEVSGYTYAVDALSPSHMTRCNKRLTEAIGDPVLNEYSSGAIADGNHFKDATLHIPAFRSVTKTYKNDHKENTRQLESDALPCEQHHIQYCGCLSPYGYRSCPEKVLLSVSEINLQTQPSQVPPPSRSPPKVVLRKGECKGMTSMNRRASPDEDHMPKTLTKSRSYLQRIFSETHALEDALMDRSLPCIKVEEYVTSAAASSAAAMKEAMEKTEAWIRIAKQSMERKQRNFQNQMRLSVNEDEKVKARREGKTAQEDKKTKDINQEIDQREKCVEDNFVGDKKCEGTRVAYIGPDLRYTTLAKESSSQWKRKGSKVTMESHKQEERAGEDQAEKFFVPAKDDKYKVDQEVPAKANEHKVNARQAFEETVGLEEKEKLCTQKEAYEWEDYYRSFEVTTKDADDWEEREKKSKTPYKHEENEKKSMACEWEEIEKKLKSAQEVRKLEQNEKKLKEAQEVGGHEENENKLKAAKESHEQEENVNLKISQEVYEWVDKDLRLKAAVEKRIQATCITAEEDENAKLKAAQEAHHEWKESEKAVQEAHELEENEKSLKAAQKACTQDENDKRITAAREANKKEENEGRLKAAEACESEENEKRLKAVQEALAWEENDNRIQAAQEVQHQEGNENGLKALQDACKWEENERKLKEAQETSRGEENEKKLSAAEEAREREEHEKLKATQEAHEWEQNEKRLKVGQKSTEQEEEKKQLRAVQAALGHEEIVNEWNKVQEAFGRAENEMKLKPASEAYKQDRNLGEMEVAHGHDNEVGKQMKAAKEVREIEDCRTPEAAKLVYKQEESKNNFKAAREACVQGKFELAGSENRLKAAQDMYELEEFKKKPKGAHYPCKQDGTKKLAAFQLVVSQDETEKKEVIGDGHKLEEYGKQLITTLEVHEYEKNEKKVNVDEVVLQDGAKEKLRETKEPCGWEDNERNTEASQFSRAEQIKQNQIVANEANGVGANENSIIEADVALDWEENNNQSETDRAVFQWLENARKFKAPQAHVLEEKETRRDPVVAPIQGAERKEKNANDGNKLDLERGERQRESELEMKQTRRIQEERERERKREKDRISVERATCEARNRTFTEAPERVAVKRATAEARQRAMAEARERAEKASAEAHEKSLAAKDSMVARFRADHAAVESATAEVRVRAAELASSQAGEQVERSSAEAGGRMRQSSSFSDVQDIRLGSQILAEGESPKRCKARFERHLRTVERAAKALAEKNLRDILSQKEQAERNRLAETLDADVRRWSNGKEGNLRALLSTLQYILGRESGWQPIPLTDVITAVAVKRAYRKATLCVHPDKVQQRGASIQEKYICGKVFDLLKEAWNNFNSDA